MSLIRSVLLLPALLAAFAATAVPAVASAEDEAGPTLEQFLAIRAPRRPTVLRGGAHYFIDDAEGVPQVFARRRGAAFDDPLVQLTNFADGVSDYTMAPNAMLMVVSAAAGGSEQTDLLILNTMDGLLRPVLTDPNVVYGFQFWLADSSGFVYSANDVEPADTYLYEFDIATGESRRIYAGTGRWTCHDRAENGARYLVARHRSSSHIEGFELERVSGRLTPLHSAGPSVTVPVGYFDRERQTVFISDHDDGRRRLFRRDGEEGVAERMLPGLDPYEVEGGKLSANRALLALTYNDAGQRRIFLARLPEFATLSAPVMPPGVVGDLELHGRLLAWTLSNQQLPGVPYSLKVSSEPIVFPLAAADDRGVDLTQIPLPEAVTYPGHEGLEIPALLYRPVAAARGSEGPVPFVIMFHGGPESQARPDCRRFVAWLQSRGFGVLRPNVRGSTGYGRAYQLLDDGPRRMDAVRDGVRAAEWLVEQGMAERGRIASFGGSYGGFMAVATAIEGGPELFGACVNYVGIVNFETFLERTKPYRRAHRAAEYGSLDDREFLRSISPLFAVDRLDVPVLIAHGLNDPRVPIDESMQLALALQSRGLNPETIYFPDEGHGFRKLANRTLFYRRVADFFARSIAAPVP